MIIRVLADVSICTQDVFPPKRRVSRPGLGSDPRVPQNRTCIFCTSRQQQPNATEGRKVRSRPTSAYSREYRDKQMARRSAVRNITDARLKGRKPFFASNLAS